MRQYFHFLGGTPNARTLCEVLMRNPLYIYTMARFHYVYIIYVWMAALFQPEMLLPPSMHRMTHAILDRMPCP